MGTVEQDTLQGFARFADIATEGAFYWTDTNG